MQGKYIGTALERGYGKCPTCGEAELQKKIYVRPEKRVWPRFFGRLFCPNCEWLGFKHCPLDSTEEDPIKSYLSMTIKERNQLNRRISSLKKVELQNK